MNQASFDQLQSVLGPGSTLLTDPDSVEQYSHDETTLKQMPRAVLLADSTADCKITVDFCLANQIALVPRGAGTGLSGGCVPSEGSLVLSTERMDELQILPAEKIALCGPGVITKDLADQAVALGLCYPPDPASYDQSCLGGNVAENAGGLRCKRFGLTRDYVLGLEAITGEGLEIKTGCLADQEGGFSIGDLLIGSEGTLAVITKIALRLIDLPGRGITIMTAFDQPDQAAQAVREITTSGLVPTVLEFIDGDTVALSNEYEKTINLEPAGGLLLIETSDINAEMQANQIAQICRHNNAIIFRTERDPERAEEFWRVRRNIAKAAKEAAQIKVSEDIAIPNSKFPEMVAFVAKLNASSNLRINSFGHAGDGNLHVNLLSATGDLSATTAIEATVLKILAKAINLGGTLTGEHGIGLTKREQLSLEFDENTLSFMRAIKDIFDPQQLMNPGKLLPPN